MSKLFPWTTSRNRTTAKDITSPIVRDHCLLYVQVPDTKSSEMWKLDSTFGVYKSSSFCWGCSKQQLEDDENPRRKQRWFEEYSFFVSSTTGDIEAKCSLRVSSNNACRIIEKISLYPKNWRLCARELLSTSWLLTVADIFYTYSTE